MAKVSKDAYGEKRPQGKPTDWMDAKDKPAGRSRNSRSNTAGSYTQKDWKRDVGGEFTGAGYSDKDHD